MQLYRIFINFVMYLWGQDQYRIKNTFIAMSPVYMTSKFKCQDQAIHFHMFILHVTQTLFSHQGILPVKPKFMKLYVTP